MLLDYLPQGGFTGGMTDGRPNKTSRCDYFIYLYTVFSFVLGKQKTRSLLTAPRVALRLFFSFFQTYDEGEK